MKQIKIGLLGRIIMAMIVGVALGYVMPMWGARLFMTFNALFSQFLGFLIPLIIVGFVVPAIAEIGGKAGKMLLVTAIVAYVATLFSGLFSYVVSNWTFPYLIVPGSVNEAEMSSADIAPFFTIGIPPLFGVMTALVVAFVMGLGIAYTGAKTLMACFDELRLIVTKTISVVVLPLLPIYIFGIFMNMTMIGEVGKILRTFISIIVIIFIMHVLLLLIQYCIAGAIAHKNPIKALLTMLPAYFTALGTQSSAATIPVTLRQSEKTGVHKDVAGFVVPLCATIHLSGSTLKIVACALALMIMQGIPYTTPMFIGFIAMLGVTMVAAPGVPGGAIMACLGVLSSMLGFTEADNALMIALYIAMDSFGTACNVTGDGAIALIIDRLFVRKTSGAES
ncbi:MAG: dicarboxylate/amino acid:cation symporter [Muribaculaceae bacterium]|nr:dicarboxylate/amino acid:cation symporter [Muribaculaceae bacterium]